MDIRGLFAYRLGENGIDQADDGSVVCRIHQVAHFRNFVGQPGQVHIGTEILGHLTCFIIIALVVLGQASLELAFGHLLQGEGAA